MCCDVSSHICSLLPVRVVLLLCRICVLCGVFDVARDGKPKTEKTQHINGIAIERMETGTRRPYVEYEYTYARNASAT